MTEKLIDRAAPPQKAIVLHPDREDRGPSRSAQARLEEAVGLARALDLEIEARLVAPLRRLTPATLFGKGKVEELAELVKQEIIHFPT